MKTARHPPNHLRGQRLILLRLVPGPAHSGTAGPGAEGMPHEKDIIGIYGATGFQRLAHSV